MSSAYSRRRIKRIHSERREKKRLIKQKPTCAFCGRKGEMTLDHILPISWYENHIQGLNDKYNGRKDKGNFQLLCERCHVRKTQQENAYLKKYYRNQKFNPVEALILCCVGRGKKKMNKMIEVVFPDESVWRFPAYLVAHSYADWHVQWMDGTDEERGNFFNKMAEEILLDDSLMKKWMFDHMTWENLAPNAVLVQLPKKNYIEWWGQVETDNIRVLPANG